MNQKDSVVTTALHRRVHFPPYAFYLTCGAALIFLGMTGVASAETLIHGIRIHPDSKGTSVSIQDDRHPAYDINILNHGYRVRMDFQDAHILNSAQTVAGAGVIENVLAENDGKNAHLDLLLSKPEAVMVEPSLQGYHMSLVSVQGKQKETATPTTAIQQPSPINSNSAPVVVPSTRAVPVVHTGTQIETLRFHREKDGGGMLRLDMQGQQPSLEATRASNRLIVELHHTQIPASLTHRFGTDQFGTPVQYIDAYPVGNTARLVFHISGPFEYSVYQLGHEVLISVHHKETNQENENPLKLVTELIPLKYARASQIADLLRGFSQQVNQKKEGGLDPKQGHALATALGIPSENLVGNSLLGARGSVAVVTRTNSLLVRDTPSDITNIKRLVAKIDHPVPQVLIEARIVQITTSAAQTLGIQWGGSYTSGGGGGIINLSGTGASGTVDSEGGDYPVGSSSDNGSSTGSTTVDSGGIPAIVNLPASAPAGSALAGLNPASLGFELGNTVGSRILSLQLQALQAANKAKIISSPKVLTQNNESATIAQGTEIPYQEASSSGATAVSFKKAELSLKVTPHIAPNGKITMKVVATNNQPNYAEATTGGIPISTQVVKTNLMANNGQTIVIGGIYTETDSRSNSGVPLLQDIPLLGWLFKAKEYSTAQTELLVFITPKIIGPNY